MIGICPQCFTRKPFWAPRCHACNTYIGFLTQLWACAIYYGTAAVVLFFVFAIFASQFAG